MENSEQENKETKFNIKTQTYVQSNINNKINEK